MNAAGTHETQRPDSHTQHTHGARTGERTGRAADIIPRDDATVRQHSSSKISNLASALLRDQHIAWLDVSVYAET